MARSQQGLAGQAIQLNRINIDRQRVSGLDSVDPNGATDRIALEQVTPIG
jgi:hypothetical protein